MHRQRRLQVNVRLALLWAAVALAAVAVACGSSDDAEPTAEETAYLADVEQAFDLFQANLDEFSTLFGQAWPLPSLMFMALEEAGAGTAMDDTVSALEAMDPPESYADDHTLLVAGVSRSREIDRRIGQSVADTDALAFVLENVALGESAAKTLLSLPTPLCNSASLTEGDGNSPVCERPQPDDGEYGDDLFALMSDLQSEFQPRANPFIPEFAFDLVDEVFAQITPEVIQILERSIASADKMDPPEEFQQDHQRLLEYLDVLMEDAKAVPTDGSPGERPVGPPPGADFGALPPGIAAFCDVREAFSEEFSRLVAVHFGNGDVCNPEPPP